MLEIRDCTDIEDAIELIREYSKIKGAESCFVSLEKELSDLASYYEGGALLMGYEDGIPIATVALKKISDKRAEIKRLYIRPEFRGRGYSRLMLEQIFSRCKELGFTESYLTTRPDVMGAGYELYKKIGFQELGRENGAVSMLIQTEDL